jgi:hypothetical protein
MNRPHNEFMTGFEMSQRTRGQRETFRNILGSGSSGQLRECAPESEC